MTSRTSSDPLAAKPHRVRFPPRTELPAGLAIEPLPLLGTSWYERGASYWARRIGIGIIFAAVLVVYPLMIEGALQAISKPGTPLYDGLAAGEIVFTIVTGIVIFRRSWRNSLDGKGASRADTRRAARVAGGIGPLAFTAGGAIAGLAVFGSLLTSGLVLAVFVTWIVPMPPAEQYARRTLAEHLRVRHGIAQLSPRSKHYGSKNHRKR